jgi:hypothetical protein
LKTTPTTENISKCNQQLQSPLFEKVAPEIRNNIFSLALLQYEDLTKPYSTSDHRYRPGHRAKHIFSLDLLLTCRRVWLEANHWPMEQAVHILWNNNKSSDIDERCEFDEHCADNHDGRMCQYEFMNADTVDLLPTCPYRDQPTLLQKSRIKQIHIFTRLAWLDEFEGRDSWLYMSDLWKSIQHDLPALHNLTVTIRHTDWRGWETDQALPSGDKLKGAFGWVTSLLRPETNFSEFRLQLETLE